MAEKNEAQLVEELISKVRHEEFIHFHAVIEAGSFAYAVFETLAEAEIELTRRQNIQMANPGDYDSTHVKWSDAHTKDLQEGDEYKTHTTFTHGFDDGFHGSKRKYYSDPRPGVLRWM